MKKRPKRELNDGWIYILKVPERKNSFSAPIAPKSRGDMEELACLAYKEMSKRDEDYSFAESVGKGLSMKVKTHIHLLVSKTCKCIISDMLYDIIKIDFNKAKDEMYLYLEEVRKIE